MKKILVGLTTTPSSDWREKVEEAKKFNIKEVALFPTFLVSGERVELYKLIENSPIKSIPHVHLRDDMEEWELDYFVKKYGTQLFNIHASEKNLNLPGFSRYSHMMYVENSLEIDNNFAKALQKCAGICLDVSHYEDFGFRVKECDYSRFASMLQKNKVGCCHISAIMEKSRKEYYDKLDRELDIYNNHFMNDLSELDYVFNYIEYLPEIISIELENDFASQLKAKEHLNKIINEKYE
jgi:hypothetical protein